MGVECNVFPRVNEMKKINKTQTRIKQGSSVYKNIVLIKLYVRRKYKCSTKSTNKITRKDL